MTRAKGKKQIKVARNFSQEVNDALRSAGWNQIQDTAKSETSEYSVWSKGFGGSAKHLTLVVFPDHGWEIYAGFDGPKYNEEMVAFIGTARRAL